MIKGKIQYVPKDLIDYVLPHFENTMSPLGNLTPLKRMGKGQRGAMAARMMTQALPLVDAEEPLVQAEFPGSNGQESFEERYAKAMGAVRAEQPGRVISVDDDSVLVRHEDGTTKDYQLYNNFPYNLKTRLHNSATVQPGAWLQPGQLIAKSNDTDGTGTTALGKNLRTAFMAYKGGNFEDAYVISESAAKKSTSEHLYQHGFDFDDKFKPAKAPFVSLFASKFDKRLLDQLDTDGVVKPGTVLKYDDPIIVGVRQKDDAANKVHKKGRPSFNDASLTWDSEHPAMVRDVVKTTKGFMVVTTSESPMQIGDKLSGRAGADRKDTSLFNMFAM
jgi:DNA-directed RNA polymerase beta subunit